MKLFIISLFFLFVNCYSPEGYSQTPVQIDLTGKKQFEVGEPIMFLAKIRNNTDSPLGLCLEWSDFSVYSITHSLPGDSLWHDPVTGQFIREYYSHTLSQKIDGVKEVRNHTCPASSNGALMIEPGKTLYYPMLIVECPNIENYACWGKYRYLLPKGEYHFNADFSLSNGQLFKGRYAFEILETSEELRSKIHDFFPLLENFKEQHLRAPLNSIEIKMYDATVSDPFHQYILNSTDSIMTAKALIQISTYSGRNEWLLFWYINTVKKADEIMLYYLINNFVGEDFFLYKDKAEVLRIYDRLLQSLKDRNRIFSEYLLERLHAKLQYSDHGRYSQEKFPITVLDLAGFKIYSNKK